MQAILPLLFASTLAMVVFVGPADASAQQPKMDVKLFFGASGTTFVSMLETGRERDTFAGWQIGFGPRLRRRSWFVEALFSFNRWAFSFNDPTFGSITGRVNSFELPINAGYIPYKNSYFKLFLYGGLVNHFNTKIFADVNDGTGTTELNFRPKELDFAIYQALARFGANFDVAMFNFDFNYSISMNSATRTSYRTGYHQLQLNLAYLF